MWDGGWLTELTLNNVRDLGGMPAEGGRRIRKGRLLRAGILAKATAEDIRILTQEHHVKTIVDLRGDEEIAQAPDPVIEGVRHHRNGLLPSRNIGVSHEEDIFHSAKKMGEGFDHMVSVYAMLVNEERAISRLRQFIGYLLEQKEGAVLWHCTAGKDRTGIASMILQTALGVPQDLIMHDYLYSNVCLKKDFDALLAEVLIRTDDENIIENARQMMLAREEYLQTFMTGMVMACGSTGEFLKERLGLDEKTKALLQDMYLE